jgi:hypothetical protein
VAFWGLCGFSWVECEKSESIFKRRIERRGLRCFDVLILSLGGFVGGKWGVGSCTYFLSRTLGS